MHSLIVGATRHSVLHLWRVQRRVPTMAITYSVQVYLFSEQDKKAIWIRNYGHRYRLHSWWRALNVLLITIPDNHLDHCKSSREPYLSQNIGIILLFSRVVFCSGYASLGQRCLQLFVYFFFFFFFLCMFFIIYIERAESVFCAITYNLMFMNCSVPEQCKASL